MIDTTSMGGAAVGAGILVASIYNGWQTVQARREAARAAGQAQRAADNSHPVSNGWGSKITRDLDYIRESLDRAHARLDAQEQRQTLGDARALATSHQVDRAADHARTAAEQSSAVATGLAAHLADHASSDAREATPL